MMQQVATITFTDGETHDTAVVIVRARPSMVGLAASHIKDGDIEVFLGVEECQKLAEALDRAMEIARPTGKRAM